MSYIQPLKDEELFVASKATIITDVEGIPDEPKAPKMTKSSNYVQQESVDIYTRIIAKFPLLTKAEECTLALAIRAGDKAASEKFINSNLRLVVKVAGAYRNRGLAFSDIIAEGNIGLMYAIKKFEPEKGFRFATYAVWWIRQSIERALMIQTRTIRLPVHVVKQLSRCMRQGEKMARLANKSNVSDISMAEESNMSVKDMRTLMSFRHNTVSLENKVGSDSEKDLGDFITDKDSPADNVAFLDLERHLELCMGVLKPIDVAILKARFGIGRDEEQSLNTIADENKMTRDQVRRVLHNALKTIKNLLLSQDNPVAYQALEEVALRAKTSLKVKKKATPHKSTSPRFGA